MEFFLNLLNVTEDAKSMLYYFSKIHLFKKYFIKKLCSFLIQTYNLMYAILDKKDLAFLQLLFLKHSE